MNIKNPEIQRILRSANHYEVLGVNKTAKKEQIRKAYKEKALKYHPDKTNISEAKQVFHKVTSAYEQLYSQDKRSNYDAELDRKANQRVFQNQYQNRPKKQEPRFSSDSNNFRRQQKQKPQREQFRAQKQEPKKPDFNKYLKPQANPYNPKRSGDTFPEPDKNKDVFESQQPKKRPSYKLRQKEKQGWTRVILTLICFYLFWSYVPDFTKAEPRFLLQKSEKYSHKLQTSRYKFPYFVQPQNANRTMELIEPKIQKMYIAKLEADCQNAINLKDKFQKLIQKDPLNASFWQSEMKGVSYKPCKKILKLVKKWPDIGLNKFVHLIR